MLAWFTRLIDETWERREPGPVDPQRRRVSPGAAAEELAELAALLAVPREQRLRLWAFRDLAQRPHRNWDQLFLPPDAERLAGLLATLSSQQWHGSEVRWSNPASKLRWTYAWRRSIELNQGETREPCLDGRLDADAGGLVGFPVRRASVWLQSRWCRSADGTWHPAR